jgi:hypothetical protein
LKASIHILLFLLLSSHFVRCQNETKNWFFGANAGLNFNSGNPTILNGGAITTSMGCAAISDNNGSILFYTDGVTVYNQLNAIMANGAGLLGVNAAQPAIILKKPGSSTLYYIFTVQAMGGTGGLNYSVVDMSLASGNGSVTIKNATLSANAFTGRLTAAKHCNGVDLWVISHVQGNFISYLLTNNGVSNSAVVSTHTANYNNPGVLKASPNSRKLAITTYSFCSANINSCNSNRIDLYDFDNSTGIVSNLTQLINIPSGLAATNSFFGCEFSSNGTLIYHNDFSNNLLAQSPLCSLNSYTVLSVVDTPTNAIQIFKRSFQLASNGKIYIALPGTNSVGVVNNPNVLVQSSSALSNPSSFTLQSVGNHTCQWGLPNFPGFYFEQKPNPWFNYFGLPNACMTVSFNPSSICSASGYSITNYQWNFGDPNSGPNNTSFQSNPTHTYSALGNYSVQLIRTFACAGSDTITQLVHVTSPTLSIISPSIACSINSASVSTGGGTGPYSYNWSPGSFTSGIITTSVAGVYTVNMFDLGGGCAATSTVFIAITQLSASILSTSVLCNGLNSGSATITVNGGSGNYSYNWSNSISTSSITTNLPAGNYTATATDLNNLCVITRTFQVSQPPPLLSTISTSGSVTCLGNSTFIQVNSTGGTPSYNYTWSNGSNSSAITATLSLGAHTFSISTKDQNNCLITNTVQINVVPYPVITSPQVTCCPNTFTTLIANGANSNTWLPGNFVGNAYNFNASSTTIFTISGSNFPGCATTITTSIYVYPTASINLNSNSPVCEGQTLFLNSTGGVSYSWSGPNNFVSTLPNNTLSLVQQSASGTYSLNTIDFNQCLSKSQINILVKPNPTVSISGNTLVCLGESTTLTASGALNYNWNYGFLGPIVILSPINSMTLNVTGQGQNNCTASSSLAIQFSECLGINDLESQNIKNKIFPNPSTAIFNFSITTAKHIRIVDVNGVTIIQCEVTSSEPSINLSGYPAGIYYAIIRTISGYFTGILVKQ